VRTPQCGDALRDRRKHGQPQTAEIEFSVLAAQKAIDSNVHGCLGCHLGACLPFIFDTFNFNFFTKNRAIAPVLFFL
jgi:hypothetical protein